MDASPGADLQGTQGGHVMRGMMPTLDEIWAAWRRIRIANSIERMARALGR